MTAIRSVVLADTKAFNIVDQDGKTIFRLNNDIGNFTQLGDSDTTTGWNAYVYTNHADDGSDSGAGLSTSYEDYSKGADIGVSNGDATSPVARMRVYGPS